MDKLVPGYLKYGGVTEEKDHEVNYGNYHRIQQLSEQLAIWAKSIAHHSGLEEMDRIIQLGDALKKELDFVRTDLARRKNLELLLPSPNTQHHLPCSSMLSPTSPTPSSPTAQQSMALSTTGTNSPGAIVPQSPTGSTSPHGHLDSSMAMTSSTGMMQSDEFWRRGKMDPANKMVRRSPTPLYVNLTEQMILAQSSKRKRPAEGDLYCHNCKTKDTPEWRRGPMGAKTLCNACGIRWRLSQAEAAKQKKGEQLSPTQTPQLQFPLHVHLPASPSLSPTSPGSSPTQTPSQLAVHTLLQQQAQLQRQQQIQQMQMQQQVVQQQYANAHTQHQPPHPQQQHMIMPGPVGLAQENIPNGRLSMSTDSPNGRNAVMSSLGLTPSPIAT